MLIKDLQTNTVHKYGIDNHDSLRISQDGRTLSYYNLQNGSGSKYGDYRFVMEDEKIPKESRTPDAMHNQCFFDVGGEIGYYKGVTDTYNTLMEILESFDRPLSEQVAECYEKGEW